MIAKRSAQVGFGPPDGVKADVYKEANEFRSKQQKTVETIKLSTMLRIQGLADQEMSPYNLSASNKLYSGIK